jgi:hypothetical protein
MTGALIAPYSHHMRRGQRRRVSILSACLTLPLVWAAPVHASTQVVFSYTGSAQTWTVPAGITSIQISMLGAGGAGGRALTGSTAFGGGGGFVTGTLTVVPGDTLTIIVGQGGINDNVANVRSNNYRFGGGASGAGNSSYGTYAWGSGGGRSAIRSSNTFYASTVDILTAGAGGGGGWEPSSSRGAGGAGGGLTGGDGGGNSAGEEGKGGTQTAGGAGGGGGEPGTPGIAFAGGFAELNSAGNSEAGGGGGGYWGGGGAANNSGGGGGSSYLGVARYLTGSTTAGSGRTPGSSSWPSTCGTTPGRGADPGDSATVGLGGHGCVVITYSSGTSTMTAEPLPPAPWLQAYGRQTANSECSTGWSPSWAWWPNSGTDGFTCERRLEYLRGEWVYLPGHY